ncbi:hypothetical protein [Herbidospora daliensis]|uniref:hypothetical protein n=1 Tax=Herbidospora daliensis TaxID=295585 RepID=UPI0007837A9C|nr:hypothetical protein [Herbidospora daliensis]
MIYLLIEVDGTARAVELLANAGDRAKRIATLTGANRAIRAATGRELDRRGGPGAGGRHEGEPWADYPGLVLICGLELGAEGEERAVGLTGKQVVNLRKRVGSQSADRPQAEVPGPHRRAPF